MVEDSRNIVLDCCVSDEVVPVDIAREEHVDKSVEDNFGQIHSESEG